MTRYTLFAFTSLVGCFVALLSGCSTMQVKKPNLPFVGQADKQNSYETPERIIAIWTDTVYQSPGKPATRGFGGRIYFYNKAGKVIPVNGQLVVYAYDDSSANTTTDKPTRKYGFTAQQLTRYYGESDLGASYNIWIPWDAVGNDEKQISLFPVFIDESGQTVRGSFANNRLPGKRILTEEERRGFYVSPRQKAASQQAGGVTQAQYQTPADGTATEQLHKQSGLQTTTIRVPRTMAERMAAAPPMLLQAQAYQQTPGTQQLTAGTPNLPQQRVNYGQVPTGTTSQPAAGTGPMPAAGTLPLPAAQYGTQNTQPQYRAGNGAPANYPTGQMPTNQSPNYQMPPANGAGTTPALGQTGFIGADPQNSMSAQVSGLGAAGLTVSSFRTSAIPGSNIARRSATSRA